MAFFGNYNEDDLPKGNTNDFSPIPDGWYKVEIKSAEVKPTKESGGEYINIRFDVLGPEYTGRVIFGMINLKNKSSTAEEIGRQQLGALMRAIGLKKVSDTDELIGCRMEIKVITEESQKYGSKNVPKAYRAIEGSTMPKPAAKPAATAATAGDKTPPWAKKPASNTEQEIF